MQKCLLVLYCILSTCRCTVGTFFTYDNNVMVISNLGIILGRNLYECPVHFGGQRMMMMMMIIDTEINIFINILHVVISKIIIVTVI